jgi:hypothetical protein
MNNEFSTDSETDFMLTDMESKKAWKQITTMLLYALLTIVIIITAAHGIMVVLHSTSAEYSAGSGLTGMLLNMVRISFPVTVELAAIVAGLGFISSSWRKGQKWIALGIEVTWLVFAAANMITMFNVERGLPLQSWQENWISYGLPLSALIAGSLTYMLKRADPDHKRQDEAAAAVESDKMLKFSARRDVALSPQKRAIEKQKAWVDYINTLKTQGYTQAQIRFMMQAVPQLMFDNDGDGTADLLETESGDVIPGSARPAAPKRRGLGEIVTTFTSGLFGDESDSEEPVPVAAQTHPAPATVEPTTETFVLEYHRHGVGWQAHGFPYRTSEAAIQDAKAINHEKGLPVRVINSVGTVILELGDSTIAQNGRSTNNSNGSNFPLT